MQAPANLLGLHSRILRGWPSAEHASCRVFNPLNPERILWLRKRRRRKRRRRPRRPRRSNLLNIRGPGGADSARALSEADDLTSYSQKNGGRNARLLICGIRRKPDAVTRLARHHRFAIAFPPSLFRPFLGRFPPRAARRARPMASTRTLRRRAAAPTTAGPM